MIWTRLPSLIWLSCSPHVFGSTLHLPKLNWARHAGMAVVLLSISVLCPPALSWAAASGSISGTATDPSGAVIPGASVTLVNLDRQTVYRIVSDSQGLFSLPNVPVGHYRLTLSAPGFSECIFANLAVDAETTLRVNGALTLGAQTEVVEVRSDAGTQVDTSSATLGEAVSSSQMTALPLNGRNYTDLLAIQPGVAPASTLLPSSVIMAGVTGGISPSGEDNPGNLSINGQRESANGFLVNGIDVQEHMNGGTSVVPDLDSIEQFRVLTSSFDPEYGNYNGGIVSVITKSGSQHLHGNAFEFLRNTALDARGYFDPTRPVFRRNQFGGTLGGPVRHTKLFCFGDYQGTRTTQGISTGDVSVPTLAERAGDFTDPQTGRTSLTGSVSGPYLAQLLTNKLGQQITSGEAYRDVFPTGVIPQSAISAPATHLLSYIPAPNVSASQFSTSAFPQINRDDKGSLRLDINTRVGQVSGFYFVDNYQLDNPYPGQQGGASIPGFDALTIGRAQLVSLSDTKALGPHAVYVLNVGYLRYANTIGQPKGGLGVSLASQGFTTGAGTPGIYVQAPQFEGVQNITFPTFVMGVPITNETQVNNTYFLASDLTFLAGVHTVKLGGQFYVDQVNEHPNGTFNGTFNINGTETGSPYADLLLGTPSNYTQSSGQHFYLRNHYLGIYAQDSWRVGRDLTLSYGLRWDVLRPWSEKYDQLQTYVAGAQSTLYPGAPEGLLVAGDPGIPRTLAPTSYLSLAPRIGLAYAPHLAHGFGKALFGDSAKSSIRASYGIFYTAFPGLAAGIMYAVPPFGHNYLSPAPPLLETPFITASTGVDNGQRFPFSFPSHTVSARHPDSAVNWADFVPISGDPFFNTRNRTAYIDSYMLSFQREIARDMVLTASYVGNQGHRLLTLVPVNLGSPALCLSLPGCGPFGEDATYTNAAGQTVHGTRVGQGPQYGENTADSSVANSNYNALEASLKFQRGGASFLLSYTYAKSIDQGSNLGEQLDALDPRQSRTLSAYDLKHNLVASYSVELPVAEVVHHANRATDGWSLSGTTRFSTGLPVTLFDNSDNSLLGSLGNGANNYLLDTPRYTSGHLKINTNGRNGRSAFNTALFSEETVGELGNAKRRIFYGPGIENYDVNLQKEVHLRDMQSVTFRLEAFNLFNHAQFFGPASVNGQIEDPNFGSIVSVASPRLLQLAAKFSF